MSRSLLTSKMMSCCPIACAAACTSLRSASVVGSVRVHEHGDRGRLGHELAQQLQPLRPQHAAEKADARDVAARPVEAGDEAVPDRVAAGREDNRYRRGCGLGRERRIVVADDHGHRPADQISRQSRQPIRLIFRLAEFDRDVLALDEAGFLQALAERGHEVRRRRRATCCGESRPPALPGCCARAASGHAPPRRRASVMNSRRLIRSPRRRARAAGPEFRGRAPWRS